MNGWSEKELESLRPEKLRTWIEKEIARKVNASLWCGAKDGRLDSGGARMEKRLTEAGYELRFRRIKVDQVICRQRHCNCIHKSATEPVLVRRQAGVDVDLATRCLELILTRKCRNACLVLIAGDGDFAPLAQVLARSSCQLYVVAYPHSLSPELEQLADHVLDLNKSRAWKKGDKRSRLPKSYLKESLHRDPPDLSSDDLLDDDDEPDDNSGDVLPPSGISTYDFDDDQNLVVASDNDSECSSFDADCLESVISQTGASQSTRNVFDSLDDCLDIEDSIPIEENEEIILLRPHSLSKNPLPFVQELPQLQYTCSASSEDGEDDAEETSSSTPSVPSSTHTLLMTTPSSLITPSELISGILQKTDTI